MLDKELTEMVNMTNSITKNLGVLMLLPKPGN